jgi:hypothetical protein
MHYTAIMQENYTRRKVSTPARLWDRHRGYAKVLSCEDGQQPLWRGVLFSAF